MDKKFKCTLITETEDGFSVALSLVQQDGQTNQVRGNVNLSGLTKTEAGTFKVGKFYSLTEVQ
jgi:hypothetical protein